MESLETESHQHFWLIGSSPCTFSCPSANCLQNNQGDPLKKSQICVCLLKPINGYPMLLG